MKNLKLRNKTGLRQYLDKVKIFMSKIINIQVSISEFILYILYFLGDIGRKFYVLLEGSVIILYSLKNE